MRWKGGITNDKNYFSEKVQENILISVKKVQIQRFFCYFSWNPTAFTIGYRPTAIRLGWKPIPSKARVTRDDEQAHYNARYCLPDSHFLLVFNPETSSRVTLAALGIGFQPNLHQPTTYNLNANLALMSRELLPMYALKEPGSDFH